MAPARRGRVVWLVYRDPSSDADYLAVALYNAALLALHTGQRGRSGRLGTWGFVATCVGAAAGIGNRAED